MVITDRALHEISGGFRPSSDPITACNFTDRSEIHPSGCYRSGPEITCKPENEISAISGSADTASHLERGTIDNRESVTLSSIGAGEIEARAPTMRELLDAGIARQPRACRTCGADELVPMFDPSTDYFSCEACGDVGEYPS